MQRRHLLILWLYIGVILHAVVYVINTRTCLRKSGVPKNVSTCVKFGVKWNFPELCSWKSHGFISVKFHRNFKRVKKSLAQEVRQKRDLSDRRSRGWREVCPLQSLLCLRRPLGLPPSILTFFAMAIGSLCDLYGVTLHGKLT